MDSPTSEGATRRRFLRDVGLSTAAVAFGSALLPVRDLLRAAGAQEVVLTAPELMSFAETIELATVALYGSIRPRLARPGAVAAAQSAVAHHQAHAAELGRLAGDKRVGKINPLLLPTLEDQLRQATDENGVIKVAYDLESGLASTYIWIIDGENTPETVRLAASILPIECQHSVIWGRLLGLPTKDLTAPDKDGKGYESEDRHLDPAEFPVVVTTTTAAATEE